MQRILIIDDDRLTREATRILLANKGYTVVIAESGKAGIEAVASQGFDAAIVDLFMPDMDGLRVIETIHEIKPGLPLIVASGFMFGGSTCPQMPNFEAMAAEAGAVGTLYKPFRPEVLINEIAKVTGGAPASLISTAN
jgi:CheY-like chemotaxis protein